MLVAIVLYGYTVQLPLFLDDGPQFRMVEVFTGFDQWLGSPAYFYYRPAVFSMWKLSSVLAGFFDAAGLHWLNLMLFGMTGVVLSAITYRLMPQNRLIVAFGVGVGFIIFPFNYQTVILVGAMFHTSMIFCTALTIWTGLLWWDNPRPHWLIIAILSAFWGIFSHENGVLIAPLVFLSIWTADGYKAIFSRRIITLVLPIVVITGVYLILYITVPRAESVGGLQPLQNMIESFGIMIQSVAYPLSALLRPMITETPSAWLTIIIGLITVGGGLFLVTIFMPSLNRIALLGVAWYLMALVPTVMLLDTSYVDGSPRILIYAGMGLHLFYGALFSAIWVKSPIRTHWITRPFVIAICALMLIISISFIHTRRDHLMILNRYMRDLNTLIQNQPQNPQTTPILLVNAPDYITPKPENRIFLRGSEGVAMMFYLVDYDRQIWVNTGILPMVQTVKIDEINRAQGYDVYLHDPATSWDELRELALSSATIYMTQFNGAEFYPVYVGAPNLVGDDVPDVTFGEDIVLYDAQALFMPQKGAMLVKLRWGATMDAPQPLKPFVHIMCDGNLVAQLDGHVWGDIYPFERWQNGEIQTEYRQIPMPMPFDDARCDVLVGVYHQMTLERLPARNTITGQVYLNNPVPIPTIGETNEPFPFD